MGDEMRYDPQQLKSTSIKNVNIRSKAGDLGSRRLRQIEEALGVRISPIYHKILDHNNSENVKSHDQTIQLIRAFGLISDAKVRNDILAMVIAAAQHESQSD
ncbi:hypothetical protein FF100_34340 [Methylobacterium terricola]|uniref:Uncharacterized protein n=1 Tax=Methylobacterium terricola TaxID=2583531 RepID=A0A5C4L6H7_9HYPH|nr:hypothetical protein [Methylobacterium terricola]TNC06530.1 hypothetical protein FF100_34340 [Methylobacterium terricola]